YGAGGMLLLARLFASPGPALLACVIFLAFCLALLAAFVLIMTRPERWYSPEYAAAWHDLHNHAGGVILAGETAALRQVRGRAGVSVWPLVKKLAFPAVFIIAALAVPVPAGSAGISGAGLEKQITGIERKLENAAERDLIPPNEAEMLRQRFHELRQLARDNPQSAAEAVAAMRQRVDDATLASVRDGAEALRQTQAAQSAARDAETARDGGGMSADENPAAEQAAGEAVKSMAAALDRLGDRAGGLEHAPAGLRDDVEKMLEQSGAASLSEMAAGNFSASVDSSTLQQLSTALAESVAQAMAAAAAANVPGDEAARAAGLANAGNGEFNPAALAESLLGAQSGVGADDDGATAPLRFNPAASGVNEQAALTPLPRGENSVVPGATLERRRYRSEEPLPPEEFQQQLRIGQHAARDVRAGSDGRALGPDRADAAERYFRRLAER
ncbi:MAG: hypothetical protein LIP23_06320, partial [Planctomycetes bacterium]|nr:hypothetical protein [Planctomycetota bacterium]